MVEKLRGRSIVFLVVLLFVLIAQLILSVRNSSQTWDEGDHIFAGYMAWKTADHGLNPEHPPLVKYIATLPILRMQLAVPKFQTRDFKTEAFQDAKDFLYKNDADTILLRTRIAASIFTIITALLVFAAAREMFGAQAGWIALVLFVFEPNLLAHGVLVTTDMGLSCFLFATLYAFYRYLKVPSGWRLALVGLAAGLALSAKHTGILVFPMLLLVAVADWFVRWRHRAVEQDKKLSLPGLAVSLIVVGIIAVGILWTFYGFRYAARPAGLELNPTSAEYFSRLQGMDRMLVTTAARFHLLPESYLYGLTDVRLLASFMPTYIFGKVFAHGVWYYFPVAFVIKSTLAFLVLLALAVFAIASGTLTKTREVLFLSIPPLLHLAVAMSSGLNIGARHILPLWIFGSVLLGGAGAALIAKNARWKYAVAGLLLFHAVSSARSFPTYLAYSNELWGGPANTYKYLSDSNTDWAQQLKAVKVYLDERGVKDCWFAYFAAGAVDLNYYGIPCKQLVTADTLWSNIESDVPATIEGPVLVSAGTINGFEFGSSGLNPYRQFERLQPTKVIEHGVFVFEGTFDVRYASALSHAQKAHNRLEAKRLDEALAEAQAAVAIDPEVIDAQSAFGDVLVALGRKPEARSAYEKALDNAMKLEPAAQVNFVPLLREKLSRVEAVGL